MKEKAVDRTLSVGLILLSFCIKEIASQSEIPREIVPAGSFSFNGKSYLTVMKELSWGEASTHCNQLSGGSGNLVVINDIHIQGICHQHDYHGNSIYLHSSTDEYKCSMSKPLMKCTRCLLDTKTLICCGAMDHIKTEYDFLSFIQSLVNKTLSELPLQMYKLWIGLVRNDTNLEQFNWVDGRNMTFQQFYKRKHVNDQFENEPNNFEYRCVNLLLDPYRHGYWNDDNCTERLFFMCELPAKPCIPGFTPLTSSDTCYTVVKENHTWDEAAYYCYDEHERVRIGSIESPEEQAYVEHLAANVSAAESSNIWIGLRKLKDSNNTYIWYDQSYAEYTNFYQQMSYYDRYGSEPNNVSHQCINMFNADSRKGYWNDDDCQSRFYFICEHPEIPFLDSSNSLEFVREGESVTFSCKLRSNNTDYSIVWYKWMNETQNLEPVVSSQDLSSSITINSTGVNKKEFYLCSASVEMGTLYSHPFHLILGESGPPLNITVRTLNLTTMEVSWKPPTALHKVITAYRITYNNYQREVGGDVTMVTLDGLDCWTEYQVNVSAKTEAGFGKAVSAVGVTNVYNQKPRIQDVIVGSNSINLSFHLPCENPPVTIDYNVSYAALDHNCTGNQSNVTRWMSCNAHNPCILSGLVSYWDYIIRVQERILNTAGPWSDPLYERTLPAKPEPIRNLKMVNITSSSLIVCWDRPCLINSDAVWYNISIGNITRDVGSTNGDITKNICEELSPLMPYTNYNVTVTAGNREGVSTPVTIETTTKIADYLNVTVPVESYNVTYSQSVHLNCTVTAYPLHFLVQWEKLVNGEYNAITLDERHYGSSVAEPSLTINSVEWGDGGYYRCTATSSLGKRESRPIQVTVLVNYLNVTVPVESYNVTYSQSVHLNCTVTAYPLHFLVQWEKLVNEQYNAITLDERHYGSSVAEPSLTINSVEWGDGGYYRCTATSSLGKRESRPIQVTVLVNYLNVTVPVESYNVTYSQSVHLNCTVTAYPLHFLVQWEKLVNGEYNAITLDERHYGSSLAEPSLTINSVEWGDGGYYRCTATSSLGKRESRPIQVTVLVNYLNVTVPVESYNVTYSQSVHLNCTVTAYPLHFLVQWEKLVNGEYNAITLDERHYGSSVAEPSLTINSVEWGDGGYYRCTATSSLGKRESRPIQVTVLVMAPSIDATVNNYINLTIRYWYDRPEFYNLTQRLMLHINGTRRDLPVSQQYYSLALLENTAYSLFIKSYTTYGVGTSSVKIVKTSVIPVYSKFMVAFKMTGFAYNISLFDSESDYYKNTFSQVINNVDSSMGEIKGYASSNVAMFRPGSVIVDLVVTKNQSGSNQDISGEFEQHVKSGSIGQLVVDPSYYKFSTGDGELRITQLMIYSPPELLEDAPATFICLVETFGQTGTIMANWKFNNVIISSTQISRWSQRSESVNPMLPQYRQFYLENSGLKLRDKGNISCEVYNERMSLQDERTLNIRVIPKPVVEIFPLTAIVRLGGNLTIECNVSSVDSEATIDWYKNGSPIVATSDQDTEVVIGNRGLTQVLQAKNIQRNTFFSCVGRNIAGEKSVQCNVTVIKEEDLHRVCNRSMDSYGTLWEEAVDSKLVIKPCTGNRTGNVSRLCVNGVWEEPDYSKCFRKDLLDLQEQAENLRDGASADDVNNILINLNDSSSVERGKLTSGDLSTASAALENVAEKTANQPGTFTNNNLDAFLSTTNNLLEPDNNEGWQQLKYKETDKMGKLLKALTTYSVTYTTTKDDKFNKFEVEKDNLVAEVGKVQNKDIVFPDRTKMKNEWIQNSQTVLNLPWESIDQNQKVGYVGVYCKNISDKFSPYLIEDGQVKKMDKNEDVNSDIIAFSIVPAKSKLNPPLNITFQHLNMDLTKPRCVFWDDTKVSSGAWSTVGGRLVNNTQNVSVCEFDHTTNFAILMSPMSGSTGHEKTLEYISMVGIGVSLVFLIITVLVYIVFWKHLKSARAKFLIMLCVMLIISYTVFLSGVKGAVGNKTGCTAVAVLLHYLLLVDFFLMLSVAIEIAFQILYVIPTGRSRTKGLFFFSFLGPAVIVGASVGATKFKGYGNSDGKSTSSSYCWLAADSGLIWAFIGPALLIALINLVITVLVFRAMFLSMTYEKGSKKSSKKDIAKSGARSICVLAPLFGLAWVFGVVSFSQDLVTFQYLFAIFNSLQGLFLFLFHCLLDRKVREFFLKRRKERTSAIKYSSNETPKKTKVTSGSDMNNNDLEKEKDNTINKNIFNNEKSVPNDKNEGTGYSPFGVGRNSRVLSPRNFSPMSNINLQTSTNI